MLGMGGGSVGGRGSRGGGRGSRGGKGSSSQAAAARDRGDAMGVDGSDDRKQPLDGEKMSEAYRIKQVTHTPCCYWRIIPTLCCGMWQMATQTLTKRTSSTQ